MDEKKKYYRILVFFFGIVFIFTFFGFSVFLFTFFLKLQNIEFSCVYSVKKNDEVNQNMKKTT